MDIIKAYNQIKSCSVLLHFPKSFHQNILEDAQLIVIGPNEKIIPDDSLYILVDGEVTTVKKGTNFIVETLKAGRSLELESFIQDSGWNYNWISTQKSILLKLSKFTLLKSLNLLPNLKQYLTNITHYPSLHRLKRDLKFAGVDKEITTTLFLNINKIKNIDDNIIGKNKIIIVQEGEIRAYKTIGDERVFIGSFIKSDYLFMHHKDHHLSTSDDFSGVCINIDKNTESFINNSIPLLDRLEKKTASKEREYQANIELNEDEIHFDDEDDDNFSVQDFKLNKDELARLHRRKFYHYQQHDMMDCGAACLAMISRYYGKKINISTWRSLVHITREGASMLSLKKAAEQVGFDCIGVMTGYKALGQLQVPAIALMQYHFVVVYQVNENDIWIADPASQLSSMTKEDFNKEFSNNCLLLKPNENLKKFPNSKNSFLKYLELFKDSKLRIFEILIVSLFIFILNLANPLFLQFIFDNVLVTLDEDYLKLIALIFLSVTLLTSIVTKVRGNLIGSLTSKLSVKFTSLFLAHTLKLPLSYFSVRNVGDITTRLGELEKIREFFSTKLVLTFINIFSVFIYMGVLYIYSPKLLLVFLPFIPIFLFILRYLMKKAILNLNETFKAAGKNQSMTFEQIEGINTIKSISGLLAARWKWEESIVHLLKNRRIFENISIALNSFATFFQEFIAFSLFISGVYFYFQGHLTLGQVIAINALGGSIVAPLIQLLQEWDQFNKIGVSIEKVDEIFTSPIENMNYLKDKKQSRHKNHGDIIFQNICFQYGNEHSPMVLKNVSLTIPEGKTVALVGASGSGKTTLAYMINKLYTQTKGSILIGNNNNNDIPIEDLRESIAMINQDNNIFSGTFLENITLGDPTPDYKKAIEVAKLADCHDFIMQKKGNYYHKLGENGSGISGGQKQRLNIARALYRNPDVLIMDEATSSLDSKSEAIIVNNIKNRIKNTTIVIAHRLNTITHADLIFVFHKGQIAESGSHKELLLKQGRYFQMFKTQLDLS